MFQCLVKQAAKQGLEFANREMDVPVLSRNLSCGVNPL